MLTIKIIIKLKAVDMFNSLSSKANFNDVRSAKSNVNVLCLSVINMEIDLA